MSNGVQLGSETFSPVESQIPGRLIAVTGLQLLYVNLDISFHTKKCDCIVLTSPSKQLFRRFRGPGLVARRTLLKQEHRLPRIFQLLHWQFDSRPWILSAGGFMKGMEPYVGLDSLQKYAVSVSYAVLTVEFR